MAEVVKEAGPLSGTMVFDNGNEVLVTGPIKEAMVKMIHSMR